MRKILRPKSSGMTVVEVLVGVVIFGAVVGLTSTLITRFSAIKSQIDVRTSAGQIGNWIQSALQSADGWKNTLAASGAGVACLTSAFPANDCAALAGIETPLKVVDSAGVVLSDPAVATGGYTLNGQACGGFTAVNPGNRNCPLRMDVYWQPVCAALPCVDPQVRIIGRLRFSASDLGITLNVATFGFNVVRGIDENTVKGACLSIGGVYDQPSDSCTLPMGGLCPLFTVVTGINPANQTKVCRRITQDVLPSEPMQCGPGQVLRKVELTGALVCKDMVCGFTTPPINTGEPPADPWGGADGGDGGGDGGCDGGGDGCGY